MVQTCACEHPAAFRVARLLIATVCLTWLCYKAFMLKETNQLMGATCNDGANQELRQGFFSIDRPLKIT
jgi:hypothetical protein